MGDTLKTYLLVTEKHWHDELFVNLTNSIKANWIRISVKNEFISERIADLNVDRVFIPHWSYIIPADIYGRYECIVFHVTDLPFGRGGSPLQNLIVRGYKQTMISAIKVTSEIDAGDVYLKKDLSLDGTARDIFKRASGVIEKMISEIVINNIMPKPQQGDITKFKRRIPEESLIAAINDTVKLYDHIRMLDCEGYPNAFIETEFFKFEFTKAALDTDQIVTAHVRITKK